MDIDAMKNHLKEQATKMMEAHHDQFKNSGDSNSLIESQKRIIELFQNQNIDLEVELHRLKFIYNLDGSAKEIEKVMRSYNVGSVDQLLVVFSKLIRGQSNQIVDKDNKIKQLLRQIKQMGGVGVFEMKGKHNGH